jgi:hypothetical protein
MKKCALQESSRVRARVHGNHGPDRKALPSFRLLGCLNHNLFQSLERLVIEQLAGHSSDYNDINNPATYEIAQACILKTYFTSAYRQILLQTTNRPEGGVPDEWEYTDYIENADGFAEIINQFVNTHRSSSTRGEAGLAHRYQHQLCLPSELHGARATGILNQPWWKYRATDYEVW